MFKVVQVGTKKRKKGDNVASGQPTISVGLVNHFAPLKNVSQADVKNFVSFTLLDKWIHHLSSCFLLASSAGSSGLNCLTTRTRM